MAEVQQYLGHRLQHDQMCSQLVHNMWSRLDLHDPVDLPKQDTQKKEQEDVRTVRMTVLSAATALAALTALVWHCVGRCTGSTATFADLAAADVPATADLSAAAAPSMRGSVPVFIGTGC